MVLLLAALAAATASQPAVAVRQRARVSIMVLQPYRASPQTWDPKAHDNQREILRKEPGGSDVRLRLTEFE